MDENLKQKYDALVARWPAETEVRDVVTRFGTSRVISCGPRGGRPVVLLPGGGATGAVWFPVAGVLADNGFRVASVDVLGDFGFSSGPRPNGQEELFDWLSATLDALGVDSPAIIGHSYGAMVALAFAVTHPDRVDRAVLLDPNSCFAGIKPSYLVHALPLLVRPSPERYRRFIDWETDGFDVDEQWLDVAALGAGRPGKRPVVPRRPKRDRLAALEVPVTVVLAPGSRVHDARKVADAASVLLRRGRVLMLDQGTHHCLPFAPPELPEILVEELNR